MPGGKPRDQSGAALPRYERKPDQPEALRDGTAWVVNAARPDVRSSTLMNDVWLWPVTCRAHETRRADRVLGDPFAPHLAASRGEERFGAQADSLASFALAVGVAIIDEVLQHAVVDYHIHTIAGLGAGLDTRASCEAATGRARRCLVLPMRDLGTSAGLSELASERFLCFAGWERSTPPPQPAESAGTSAPDRLTPLRVLTATGQARR